MVRELEPDTDMDGHLAQAIDHLRDTPVALRRAKGAAETDVEEKSVDFVGKMVEKTIELANRFREGEQEDG